MTEKSRTIRISTELYDFLADQICGERRTFDAVIKNLLPDPDHEVIGYAADNIVFDDFDSAMAYAEDLNEAVKTVILR